MKKVNVLLNSIEAVRKFVDTISTYECDMDMMTRKRQRILYYT